MSDFHVAGPFKIPHDRSHRAKFIEREHASAFWEGDAPSAHRHDRGVYIFSMRSGPGITPIYVGKATKTFKQEVFTDRNLQKVNGAIRAWKKGTPVLFLVHQGAGKTATRAIGDLEMFLIEVASARNPDMRNIHGMPKPRFHVLGVTDPKKGAPTRAERAFRKVLGW